MAARKFIRKYKREALGLDGEFASHPMGKPAQKSVARIATVFLSAMEGLSLRNSLEVEVESMLIELAHILDRWNGHPMRDTVAVQVRELRKQLEEVSPLERAGS